MNGFAAVAVRDLTSLMSIVAVTAKNGFGRFAVNRVTTHIIIYSIGTNKGFDLDNSRRCWFVCVNDLNNDLAGFYQ